MKNGILAVMVVAICAAQAWTQERAPSTSKLSKLGLSSMKAVSDDVGQEVRGSGFAVVGANLVVSNGGGGIVPWGFGFFFPAGPLGWGGTTIQQSGAATGGILLPPAPLVPAVASIVIPPTVVTNSIIVNGFTVNTAGFAAGGIIATGF